MQPTTQRFVQSNGIRMHVSEAGEGPLVVLCHGFPESGYSWRHQLTALAAAGYRAVAPDMRGYGQTDAPERIDDYTMFHLVGDVVGLVRAYGEQRAVVVGHDWGAPVAWHAALLRPDVFRGVAALSVPFRPRSSKVPTSVMPQNERGWFYQLYFQQPGVAEAELERDVATSIRRILYSISGDLPGDVHVGLVPRDGGFITRMVDPAVLPQWLTEGDLDRYTAEFQSSGFRGGLNWYRNIDRNWHLLGSHEGARVAVPALYIAGDRDPVVGFPGSQQAIERMKECVPQLRRTLMLPGCGHWTQQERPKEVNEALLEFLAGLGE